MTNPYKDSGVFGFATAIAILLVCWTNWCFYADLSSKPGEDDGGRAFVAAENILIRGVTGQG
jgi:hypothetical protein